MAGIEPWLKGGGEGGEAFRFLLPLRGRSKPLLTNRRLSGKLHSPPARNTRASFDLSRPALSARISPIIRIYAPRSTQETYTGKLDRFSYHIICFFQFENLTFQPLRSSSWNESK